MHVVGFQIFRQNLFLLVVVLAVGCLTPQVSLAQPANDRTDGLKQLQSQLQTLQDQIDTLQSAESTNDPFGNSRVKSVGSPRANRYVEPSPDEAIYIRLYDLSDIFAVSPHYPAVETNELQSEGRAFDPNPGRMTSGGFGGGGFGGGGGGGGVFNIPPRPPARQEAEMMNLESAQVSMKQLVAAIKATVSPDRWGDSDDEAKIQFLGNTLLIAANNDMHHQINNLLNLFREHWGKLRTVSIQAYWIRSNPLSVKSLLGERDNDAGAGVIETEAWSKFLEMAQSENRLPYASLLTGHNNQTLHTISGRRKLLTVAATPIHSTTLVNALRGNELPDEDEEIEHEEQIFSADRFRTIVGFQPRRQSFHQGAVLQATPLATRGGNFVILDLHSKINALVAEDPASSTSVSAYLPSGEKAEIKLDSTEYVSSRLSTTIRCPKGQVVLAGGMTDDGADRSEQPVMYLFVRVNVHTITEDKSDFTAQETGSGAAKPATGQSESEISGEQAAERVDD